MKFTINEFKQKKATIKFENAPYSYMNKTEYDVSEMSFNIAVKTLSVAESCSCVVGGTDCSNCYIEIITDDENFKNWHSRIASRNEMPIRHVNADLSIHNYETCDIVNYNLRDIYPFECISYADNHFTIRFKFHNYFYNKTVNSNGTKSMLIENAARLINTIDSIDVLMKSNDELYSSGTLSKSDGCHEDLTNLLVDQKELCYRKGVDVLRQLLKLH